MNAEFVSTGGRCWWNTTAASITIKSSAILLVVCRSEIHPLPGFSSCELTAQSAMLRDTARPRFNDPLAIVDNVPAFRRRYHDDPFKDRCMVMAGLFSVTVDLL